MSDKGIIFSAPMVRALLDGRKTQTRRLVKPVMRDGVNPNFSGLTAHRYGGNGLWMLHGSEDASLPFKVPYAPGDRLYVRERGIEYPGVPGGAGDLFRHFVPATPERGVYWSRNNGGPGAGYSVAGCSYEAAKASPRSKVRPSIHMPRWASRLTLSVTDVRVQRVAEISEEDAVAEGAQEPSLRELGGDLAQAAWSERQVFQRLWDSLHTKPGETWADNPWVVAVTFEVKHGNIDRSDHA